MELAAWKIGPVSEGAQISSFSEELRGRRWLSRTLRTLVDDPVSVLSPLRELFLSSSLTAREGATLPPKFLKGGFLRDRSKPRPLMDDGSVYTPMLYGRDEMISTLIRATMREVAFLKPTRLMCIIRPYRAGDSEPCVLIYLSWRLCLDLTVQLCQAHENNIFWALGESKHIKSTALSSYRGLSTLRSADIQLTEEYDRSGRGDLQQTVRNTLLAIYPIRKR